MSAMFEMVIGNEILEPEEIAKITGCAIKSDQIDWFSKSGWVIHKNRAGKPIVGRLYARLKLAGINPASLATTTSGWTADFSGVK